MSGFYFYTVIATFLLGVFVQSYSSVSEAMQLLIFLGSFIAAALWVHSKLPAVLMCSLALLFFGLGVLRMETAMWQVSDTLPVDEEVEIIGTIVRYPELREKNIHAYVRLQSVNLMPTDEVVLAYIDRNYAVAYGTTVTLRGSLQQPEAFETDLGRTFAYPEYLRAQGVSLVMYYPEMTTAAQSEAGLGVWLFRFKDWFKKAVEQVIPEPAVGLGEGLLLGEKSGLGGRLEEVFRRTGIIHIVVLSGYNVMLVVVFVMTMLSYLFGKRVRIVFGLVAILAFAVLVGLSATVVRASIMAALLLVSQATGQTYAVLRALFLAALLMVLWNPYLVAFDPGFQLSFVATLGLILLAPKLEERLTVVPEIIGLRSFLVATLATQFFVLPLLLYQIGEVSLVSVIVNVLVLPMVPVAMLLTFLAGLTTLLSETLALFVGYVAYLSLQYILMVATWFSTLPFASYSVPPFGFGWVIFGYGVLGAIVWRLHVSKKEEDTLAGWVIVEETEDGSALRADPSRESIFFRQP